MVKKLRKSDVKKEDEIQRKLLNLSDALSSPYGNSKTAVSSKFPGFRMIEPRIELKFNNLGMRLRKKDVTVLHGVTGEELFSLGMIPSCLCWHLGLGTRGAPAAWEYKPQIAQTVDY